MYFDYTAVARRSFRHSLDNWDNLSEEQQEDIINALVAHAFPLDPDLVSVPFCPVTYDYCNEDVDSECSTCHMRKCPENQVPLHRITEGQHSHYRLLILLSMFKQLSPDQQDSIAEQILAALRLVRKPKKENLGGITMTHMKLINLTPHPVTFIAENGEVILELPGCPNPPRASETRETHGEINGIPVNKVVMGEIQDLPDPQPGVGYIVSRIVAEAVRRSDLYIPDQTVRDEQGRIIGCKALAQV